MQRILRAVTVLFLLAAPLRAEMEFGTIAATNIRDGNLPVGVVASSVAGNAIGLTQLQENTTYQMGGITIDGNATIAYQLIVDGLHAASLTITGPSTFVGSTTLVGLSRFGDDIEVSSAGLALGGSGAYLLVSTGVFFATDGIPGTTGRVHLGNIGTIAGGSLKAGDFLTLGPPGGSADLQRTAFRFTGGGRAPPIYGTSDGDKLILFEPLAAPNPKAAIGVSNLGRTMWFQSGQSQIVDNAFEWWTNPFVGLKLRMVVKNTSGHVGIGTTNPASKLDVLGTVTATYGMQAATATFTNVTAASMSVVGDTELMGNVGIGTASPGAGLEVRSTGGQDYNVIFSSANGTLMMAQHAWGHIEFAGTDPTLGTCTNGSVHTESSDGTGRIEFSDTNNTCALVFAHTWHGTPNCVCSAFNAGAQGCDITAQSTTGITFAPEGGGSWGSGEALQYICFGMHPE